MKREVGVARERVRLARVDGRMDRVRDLMDCILK